jgi:anhydro-N-acetylmuramic acid kinase
MHEVAGPGKLMRALGLMSGTSMDGIDVALVETDGEYEVQRGPSATYPYSHSWRDQLKAGLEEAAGLQARRDRPGRLRLMEQYLTDLHAEAVAHFLQDNRIAPETLDVIGFHGHTVLHRPQAGLTVQLGDGALLAKATGKDVVYDLRAADVEAGGQGAPLVPVYHRALVAKLRRPVAVVNIGGVSNVTWVAGGKLGDQSLLAFDTGPGNALIDDWMQLRSGRPLDSGGEFAAKGRVDDAALSLMLAHPYFAAPAPKSLDRNAFSLDPVASLSAEDGAATLAAFTAAAIARSRHLMPDEPKLWVVTGGGRKNKTLMSMLAAGVENAVVPAEVVGLDGDSLEAEAWAYLAVRSLKGLPISYPGTTGVREPTKGGVLARALR